MSYLPVGDKDVAMTLQHGDLTVTLDDAWLELAGAKGFTPTTKAYRTQEVDVSTIYIADIAPMQRKKGTFAASEKTKQSAEQRTVSILRAMVQGTPLPPIKVIAFLSHSRYRYKLTDGTHRLYCSLALGFLCIPHVQGFDWDSI